MSAESPRRRCDRRSPHTRITLVAAAGVALALAACGSTSSSGSAPAPAAAGSGGSAAAAAPAELRIAYQLVPNGDLVVKHEKWLETALPTTKITWTKFDSGGDVNTASWTSRPASS